ncbi:MULTISPECIES: type II toxin-antitoxin system VapC family toxin [unclassified Thioalkalivibrio]|uniref:type II toxin-antitoxin system VapC family toxin n=1 Tax=unclassified Thioalkalivibrio TaxID=2621013 RepID=UPI00036659AE|nr:MULTISPECIES: type II toxin-antitoxin system VapC family toxin [unclassified Thioalkalivibrio]
MRYLDTSVLVAALTREPRTEDMQNWLAAQGAGSLCISDWALMEFSAALSMKVRMEILTPRERATVLGAFAALRESSLSTLPISSIDYHTAALFADDHASGLRAGDALHLAIAYNHGVELCSLDKTLVAAAEPMGVNATLL